MNTIFYHLFSMRIWYNYKACKAGILGNITASIVVRVKSFESVYQDHWIDSKMS